MISTILLATASIGSWSDGKLNLQYEDRLDKYLLKCKLPYVEMNSAGEKVFARLKTRPAVSEQDILEVSAAYLAPWWFHQKLSGSQVRLAMKAWLAKKLPELKNGAEKSALTHLIIKQDHTTNPRLFSNTAIDTSSLVAMAVINAWGINFCKTESDLSQLERAKTSFQSMPSHKYFKPSTESSYQWGCYYVRHDFAALRKALDYSYQAAALSPNPNAVKLTKEQQRRWEEHLKKNGY